MSPNGMALVLGTRTKEGSTPFIPTKFNIMEFVCKRGSDSILRLGDRYITDQLSEFLDYNFKNLIKLSKAIKAIPEIKRTDLKVYKT